MNIIELIQKHKISIIVIILVIIIIYLSHTYYSIQESMIAGMWEAPDNFCDEAGIDHMYVKIGDKEDGYYKTCIIMIENNKVILDETIGINFNILLPKKVINTTITMDKDIELMPASMYCTIDLNNGVMVWKDDDKEYGRFHRIFI